MSGMTVADYVVAFLASIGVRHVFGYPGSPLVPLLAAIGRQDTVQWILMRHENAAALAASATAKRTGRLGVCCLTSGPGALQAVCGVADANLDRAPLLALTGLVARSQQGHWDFQDVDQTRFYGSILAQSLTCSSSSQVVALLRKLSGYALQQQAAAHLALAGLNSFDTSLVRMRLPDKSSLSDGAPSFRWSLLRWTQNTAGVRTLSKK